MGVKAVFKWTSDNPATSPKAYEELCKAAEELRGSKRQRCWVECTFTDAPKVEPGKPDARQTLSRFRFSDQQDRVCLVLASSGQVVCAPANVTGKANLLERLGANSRGIRRGIQFEGIRFSLGDFALFAAQATNLAGSKEFLAVVAEIEYLPLTSLTSAEAVLQDFARILRDTLRRSESCPQGELQALPVKFHDYQLSDQFTVLHSAVQFYDLCRRVAR